MREKLCLHALIALSKRKEIAWGNHFRRKDRGKNRGTRRSLSIKNVRNEEKGRRGRGGTLLESRGVSSAK